VVVSFWVWAVTVVGAVAVLAVDVFLVGRRRREPSMRECALWLAVYLAAAIGFGVFVWHSSGARYGAEFFAGWLTEYSLSIDNLFVFLIILGRLRVPRRLQQSALLIGIVLALIMRAVLIAVGAAVINAFAWVFYLFGAFLIYTAISLVRQQARHQDEAGSSEELRLVGWLRRRVPTTEDFVETKLVVRRSGRRLITPMLLVVVALGLTDLLFAFDSIPAIYGLTQQPYLVVTANLFALMGLRQLYFLLGGLLQRLVYLSLGLAALLGFIGVKLILHALHQNSLPFVNAGRELSWAPEVPTWLSLAAIVGVLSATVVASLLRSARAGAGSVRPDGVVGGGSYAGAHAGEERHRALERQVRGDQ